MKTIIAALLALGTSASAGTITFDVSNGQFDGQTPYADGLEGAVETVQYYEGDYVVDITDTISIYTQNTNTFGVGLNFGEGCPGPCERGVQSAVISRIDGGAFTLESFEITDFYSSLFTNSGEEIAWDAVAVKRNYVNGRSDLSYFIPDLDGTNTVTVADPLPALSLEFAFSYGDPNGGILSQQYVNYSRNTAGSYSIANVRLTNVAAVPTPASFGMLALAIGALGWRRSKLR